MRSQPNWIHHPFVPKFVACLFEGYSRETLRKDLISGVTVGIIALPLAMAFAIASGVEPSRGLYTAVIAGFLISLIGGSRVQIGGPTGAFVVIVYSTLERHGYEGLVVATLIASVLLVLMGLCRVGQLIRFVPYPIIIGFTTGLALLLFTAQIKEFFGFSIASLPADFFGKWAAYFTTFSSLDFSTTAIGVFSIVIIVILRRVIPSFPWGITAIVLATIVTAVFGFDVETIGSRYGALPSSLPPPSFPTIIWSVEWIQGLLPDALAIALLAGLESLLSAVMGDGMSGGRHKSDCELVAQGIANAASVLFGGIPATGAIARTAANVKTGAKTPLSGIVHAITLFVIMMVCAPLVSSIPLAALSGVIMVVAWNMAEAERFFHLFNAPRGDVAVMLTAFVLTVLVDLSFAVQMAMLLALFLFMKRMSERAGLIKNGNNDAKWPEEKGIEVYEIQGPLFFGVVDRIRDLAHPIDKPPKVFVLRMQRVPMLDASGMYALSELSERCRKTGTKLVLAGVREESIRVIKKFGLEKKIGEEHLFEHVDDAMVFAREKVFEEALLETVPEKDPQAI